MLTHGFFNAQCSVPAGQFELDQFQRRGALAPLWRAAEFARQAWQHALQRLHLQRVGRCRSQLHRQCMGLVPLFAALQHPHLANARLGMVALRIHRRGQVPFTQAFALLAHGELQPRMAPGQPGVAAVQALQGGKDRQGVAALLQALGALVQRHGQVDIVTLLQGTRIGAERHLLVTQQAQVGKDEV